jgi:hypothetical protein
MNCFGADISMKIDLYFTKVVFIGYYSSGFFLIIIINDKNIFVFNCYHVLSDFLFIYLLIICCLFLN